MLHLSQNQAPQIDFPPGIPYSEHDMNGMDTILSELCQKTDSKIVLLVMDGVGDCDNDGIHTGLLRN